MFWILILLLAFLLLAGVLVSNELIIKKLAKAIAKAEGFYIPGSRPARNHNPGNMTLDIIGKAIVDGNGKAIVDQGPGVAYVTYKTDADGWEALEKQVRLMFNGSRIYTPSMTIEEMARKYTATQQTEWARNVAAGLGVPVTTKLKDLVA